MTRRVALHPSMRPARRQFRTRGCALLLALFCSVLPGVFPSVADAAPTASAPVAAPAVAPNPAAPVTGGLVLKSSEQGLWVAGLKSLAIATLALSATAAGLFWLRNRYRPLRAAERAVHAPTLLTSRRASQKTVLLVVQWENQVYLLAESAGTTQLVDKRELAASPAADQTGPIPINGSQPL